MSVVGVDFGNESVVIAQAQRGGIDIILNESSNRKNPCMVSFQGKQRFMGEGALSIARSNYRNTVREMKRLVGRKWKEADVQRDAAFLPYKIKEHPKTGGVAIEVMYNDEPTLLTPEQVVAMMLTKVMDIAKAANSDIPVADAVVSVPGWYTDSMRRSMLDACRIAGLNCMRLMHETTATALAYGIYKSAKGLFTAEPQYVLFVDVGHATFSASVATFTQEALVVKSAAYDRNLGGRDFDMAVAQQLAEQFKAKHGKDPRDSPKSLIKLLDAAERAKKNLSPLGVKDTVVNIECLVEETDFNTRLSLDEFEALIVPLLERLAEPVERALREAGVAREKLSAVEVVGGGTRVPAVKRKLAELVGADQSQINFGLSCTLNADESVARGCALQCAILSSRFRVKDFGIVDVVPYPYRLAWEGSATAAEAPAAEDGGDEVEGKDNATVIFKKNDETPKLRRVTFRRSEDFTIAASYDDSAEQLPEGCERAIGEFRVLLSGATGGALAADKEPARVRVNVRHDINGLLGVSSAQLMEEVMEGAEDAAAAGKDAESKMDIDSEGKAAADAKAAETVAGASADAVPAGAAAAKKKFRKVNLDVETKTSARSQAEIDALIEAEAKMANQDRVLRETADKRNELESYIYLMRDKVADTLKNFASERDAAQFQDALTAAEEWLYSDEGFDAVKSVYAMKLAGLRSLGDPIERRQFEAAHRAAAASDLTANVETYKKLANSLEEAYAHIAEAERTLVRNEATAAESWLFDKLEKQGSLPQSVDPAVTVAEVRERTQQMINVCKPILSTPKPVPVVVPEPKPEDKPAAAAAEPAPVGGAEGKETGAADEGGVAAEVTGEEAATGDEAAVAGSETSPMETEDTAAKEEPTAMETDEK